jgi:hypothetical protein
MYNEQIEKLIEISLMDGELTEDDKKILFKKAESFGIDLDEFQMYLNKRIHQVKEKNNIKELVQKCPNCGEPISGLNKVCSACGYILNGSGTNGDNNKDLHAAINSIESLIVEVKSYPEDSFLSRMKYVALTYFTLGLYILVEKFLSRKKDSFESLVAKCEKEERHVKTYYGEDKKVKGLLEELDKEITTVKENRKKRKQRANIGCLGLILPFLRQLTYKVKLDFFSGQLAGKEI